MTMIGVCKGYPVISTLPGYVSLERRRILEAFGAQVVITLVEEGTAGAIRRAYQIYEESPDHYYMPNQFSNPNNWRAHYETTGPEIFAQTNGQITTFFRWHGNYGDFHGDINLSERKEPRYSYLWC